MKKIWKYLLFFLLCFAFALAVNLPIRQLLAHIKLPDTVAFGGVEGTVVRGWAREVYIEQFVLRDVSYRFKPSCLPLLKLCFQIEYEQGVGRVAYDLLNGDTEISQARFEYQAADLAVIIPNLLVQPVGLLELFVDDMAIVAGKPAALNGRLIWRDLGVEEEGTPLNLGDYQVDFSGALQKYKLKFNDLDASLEVDGKGDLGLDGRYDLDIKISSADAIEPRVKSALDLFAAKVGYNNYRFEQSGQLPPYITRQLFQ